MAVFTFVMLLGNVMKEILALLVSRQVSLGVVLHAVGLLIPFVMAYVLPFGMLTATLLVFGRFSADQELTAVRASGVSLLSLITPVIILSLLLCGLSAVVNLWVAPQCRNAYKNLVFTVMKQSATSLITEERFIDEIPGIVLYVGNKEGNYLEDVRLYVLENNQIKTRTYARRGEIILDQEGQKISFRLFESQTEARNQRDLEYEENFVGPPSLEPRPDWIRMQMPGQFETHPPIPLPTMRERKPKLSEMDIDQLQKERRELEEKGISSMPVRVQINRQISFSFACFAFTLIGIPLGIQAHRRETSIGIAISLGLIMVYYSFFILGDAIEAREHLRPDLIVWIPNFLFQGIGAFLLWRANGRG